MHHIAKLRAQAAGACYELYTVIFVQVYPL